MQQTREDWLTKAADELAPRFKPFGKFPEKLHLITSFPARKSKHNILGMCFPPMFSKDKGIYITISPGQGKGDEVEVLGTLVHEMVHAVNFVAGKKGHGKCFSEIAKSLGLEGKMTATTSSKELEEDLKALAKKLGPYPHIQIVVPKKEKNANPKTNGGAIKFASPEDPEYNIFMYKKWVELYGPPLCPLTKKPMELVD